MQDLKKIKRFFKQTKILSNISENRFYEMRKTTKIPTKYGSLQTTKSVSSNSIPILFLVFIFTQLTKQNNSWLEKMDSRNLVTNNLTYFRPTSFSQFNSIFSINFTFCFRCFALRLSVPERSLIFISMAPSAFRISACTCMTCNWTQIFYIHFDKHFHKLGFVSHFWH